MYVAHALMHPHKLTSGEAFVLMDRYLDSARGGILTQESIAQIVLNSLFAGEALLHYDLGPFVIMPNHVHVLLLPKVNPSQLLKSLKGSTAREANRLLNRTGEPFWQRESYDHWVRNTQEWDKIARYIETNPVKAGLAKTPEEYRWSSVHTSVNAAR